MPTGHELWNEYHRLSTALIDALSGERPQIALAWTLQEKRLTAMRTMIEVFGTKPRVFAVNEKRIHDLILDLDDEVASNGK